MEEKKEFLTPEQRKGLIYGSLISSVLGGLAGSRGGGGITQALGTGALSGAQAFGGGIEEIANQKHREIEEAKMQEVIDASQASTAMAKKNYASMEAERVSRGKHEAAQTSELERAAREKTSQTGKHAALLQKYMEEQRNPAPGMSPMAPDIYEAIQASPDLPGLARILSGETKSGHQTFNIGEQIKSKERLPEITEKAQAPRKEEERKVPVAVAEIGAKSRERVAQEKAKAPDKTPAKIPTEDKVMDVVKKRVYDSEAAALKAGSVSGNILPYSKRTVDRWGRAASFGVGNAPAEPATEKGGRVKIYNPKTGKLE